MRVRAGSGCVVTWVALTLALAACATYDLPVPGEANLRTAGGGTVSVTALSCRPDGSVVAAGIERAGVTQAGGVLLRSGDRGLNWQMLQPDPALTDLSPWFVDDPRASERALYVTGYRNVGLVTAVTSMSYALGPWLVSRDDGRTWQRAEPLAPFGRTTSLQADPQALLQLDAAGTLAFLRTEGMLVAFGDPRLLLLRSRDGGHTWVESVLPGITSPPHGMVSDGRGRVVIAAGRGRGSDAALVVLRSDDGGENWIETLSREHAGDGWGLAGRADGTLILWNRRERGGRAYFVSGDGGRTWAGRSVALWRPFAHVVGAGAGRWVALSVEPAGDAQEAIAWVSADDGRTWTLRRTGIRRSKAYELMGYASTLVDAGNGVLIAHAGGSRIARSADRGETWSLHAAALPDRDFGLGAHCADGKGLVVLGGEYGLLVRSTDFGVTWQAGRIGGAPQ